MRLKVLSFMLLTSSIKIVVPIPINSTKERSCGYIEGKFFNKLNIYQGQNFSMQEFETFYKNLSSTTTVQVEDGNCFIEICGHPTILKPKQRVIKSDCVVFKNSTNILPIDPFELVYEATSILCGCERPNNRPNCQNETCQDRSKSFLNDTTVCAILYEDKDCKDCYFDGIKLSHNETFETGRSRVIRSAYVQPECFLYETGFGYSQYVLPEYPTQDFRPYIVIHNESTVIKPSYTRRGEDFFCTCPKLLIPVDPVLITSSTEDPLVIAGIGMAGLFIIAGVATIIFKRYFSQKKKKIFPKDLIIKFINGNVNEELKMKFLNKCKQKNIPPGVSQAVCAPFNKSLEIPRENIHFEINEESVLGNGIFGIVYKGTLKWKCENKSLKQDVAIKTVKPFSENGYIKSILNEVKVLAYIGEHPNILQLVGACICNLAGGEVYIVLQLCANGSLKKFLESIKNSLVQNERESTPPQLQPNPYHPEYLEFVPVENEKARTPELCQSWLNQFFKWSKEIATGMEFLSEKGVLHVDLGARNILLTEDLTSKIGDFGLSRKLYGRLNYFKHGREPVPKINALESLAENKYSIKSDVWAYGVTLWEIFSLADDPYTDLGYVEIIDFLNSGQRLPCPPYSNEEIYKNSMLRCWNLDLEERPSFSQMKEYFENILKNYDHEVRDND